MGPRVLGFNYILKNPTGEILDESKGEPLHFMEGLGQILPKLEEVLLGMAVGGKQTVKLVAEDGYGEVDSENILEVPREELAHIQIEEGMHLQLQMGDDLRVVKVSKVGLDQVTLDANHPLAGVDLHFEIELVSSRPATSEELEHGHAHGPGGHNH